MRFGGCGLAPTELRGFLWGLVDVFGEDRLNGRDGMDGGFGGFPASYDVANIGGGGFEPPATVHTIPVFLIQIGTEMQDLCQHPEISGAVDAFTAEEPA